jgi:hypothetical protein
MKLRDSNGEANHAVPWSNGALRPPHPKQIGPAHAYFLKLEDMVTGGAGWDGIVCGGKPVSDEEMGQALGLHVNTIARHRLRLERYGYITLKRTPHGYVIRVAKSKKWALIQERRSARKAKSDPPNSRIGLRSDPPQTSSDPPKTGPDPQLMVDVDQTVVGLIQDEAGASTSEVQHLWEEIDLRFPIGTPEFQSCWKFYYNHRNGQSLSEAMERCIQNRQAKGLPVPPQFYAAKRRVEELENRAPEREPIHTISRQEIPV